MDEIDPIDELHEIRRRLIEKAGGTIELYIKQVMEEQKNNPNVVDLSNSARQSRPRRKSAALKTTARKPAQRRKAVAVS